MAVPFSGKDLLGFYLPVLGSILVSTHWLQLLFALNEQKRVPLLLVNLFSPLCRIQLHLIGYRCIRNEQLFLRYLCFFHSYREGMHLARHQNRFLSFFQYSGLKQHKFVSHHILFSAESDQWSKNGTLGFRIQIDRSWHKFSFLSPTLLRRFPLYDNCRPSFPRTTPYP